MTVRMEADGPDALIDLKVVPGARRDEVVGSLGDRLKVRTAAAPEGGRANEAVLRLLAQKLGVRRGDLSIESGASSAEKRVRIRGIDVADVRRLLVDGRG